MRFILSGKRTTHCRNKEHDNVLKNYGYNLEHNFGHGERHASEIYAVVNHLGYLIHGLMLLLEEEYQKTWVSFGMRNIDIKGYGRVDYTLMVQ